MVKRRSERRCFAINDEVRTAKRLLVALGTFLGTFFVTPPEVEATHRLGSVINLGVPDEIGPDSGEAASFADVWQVDFSPPAAAGGTKFLMLHFTSASLPGDNRLEVDLGYDTDVFTSASGASFWTRPIEGNSVTVRYIDDGNGAATGSVILDQYGRGEGLQNGGEDNANADLFLIDPPPYDEPTYQFILGQYPQPSAPTWLNVDCLPNGTMKTVAESVGIMVWIEDGQITSCTATLIDSDVIITAGHCILEDELAVTGSITFDYQTNCDGTTPGGYDPRFYKMSRVLSSGFNAAFPPGGDPPLIDYAIIQIDTPPGGLGIPPIPLRPDVPPVNESLFIIHHPRASTKKISREAEDSNCDVGAGSNEEITYFECDVDNGSSGASIFDSNGEVVANLGFWDSGPSIILLTQEFLTEPPPPKDVDVMMVFDRSGSMSLAGLSGMSKLQEAQQAASLFVDLLDTGPSHQMGLVSFSGAPSLDYMLQSVTNNSKNDLIGPPHPGIIENISAGGSTSIGGGLQDAQTEFPAPDPDNNTSVILLMTDGLQNTAPSIQTVEPQLAGTRICAIGFGTEANLNGPILTQLAHDHGGVYTRAGEGLELKKFFVLCFGNIFENAISMDPFYTLPREAERFDPIPFRVCGASLVTAVLGWEHREAELRLELVTPSGVVVDPNAPEVVASSGATWAYLKVRLPYQGDRNGEWSMLVSRSSPTGRLTEERFFVTSLAEGSARLTPLTPERLYTGDVLNPRVWLRDASGGRIHDATVEVEITRPEAATGNILTESGLGEPRTIDGDALTARTSTLVRLEEQAAGELIPTITETYNLFDDAEHNDGSMEEDGIYGNPLEDLTLFEGTYTFRAIAKYEDEKAGCVGTRETTWSIHIVPGIDAENTTWSLTVVGPLRDGRELVRVTFVPADGMGNHVGPGRSDFLDVAAAAGSELSGKLNDDGGGLYSQGVAWDPTSGQPPGILILQEGRDPVRLGDEPPADPRFVRGDANLSGGIDVSDGIGILSFLFLGALEPACQDAADTDDSGDVSLTDAVRIFAWLFTGGPAPAPPTPRNAEYGPRDCGTDPTADRLECAQTSPACSG